MPLVTIQVFLITNLVYMTKNNEPKITVIVRTYERVSERLHLINNNSQNEREVIHDLLEFYKGHGHDNGYKHMSAFLNDRKHELEKESYIKN
jgi:hypothetical protein